MLNFIFFIKQKKVIKKQTFKDIYKIIKKKLNLIFYFLT